MTKHRDIEELIQKLLDREITVDENINLQLHISQCSDCQSLYDDMFATEQAVVGLTQLIPNHDFNSRVLKAVGIKKSRVWAKVAAVFCGAWLVTVLALLLSPISGDIFNRILTSSPAVVRFINSVQFIGSTLTRIFAPLAKSQFNPTMCIVGLALSIGMFITFGKIFRKKEIICTA